LPAVVDRFTSALSSTVPTGLFLADGERGTALTAGVGQ